MGFLVAIFLVLWLLAVQVEGKCNEILSGTLTLLYGL